MPGYSISAATTADIQPHEVENLTGSAENPPTYSSVVNNQKYTTLPSYVEAKSLRSQPNSISGWTNGDQEQTKIKKSDYYVLKQNYVMINLRAKTVESE